MWYTIYFDEIYINKEKASMTDKERIKYLENAVRELRKDKERLRKENGVLKKRIEEISKMYMEKDFNS